MTTSFINVSYISRKHIMIGAMPSQLWKETNVCIGSAFFTQMSEWQRVQTIDNSVKKHVFI